MTVYVTGDTHGDFKALLKWADKNYVTMDDVIIVLGDAGLNYYLNYRDRNLKQEIQKKLNCILFIVRGNHEYRPEDVLNVPYHDEYTGLTLVREAHNEEFFGNTVLVEDKYPKIKYAKDGYIYNINGYKTMVIGGAYSVDMWYRLENGWTWVPNEQLDDVEFAEIYETFCTNKIDALLTHTAPTMFEHYFRYLFMEGLNQDQIDKRTERWLNKFYWCENNEIKLHYFGHFHANINCGPTATMLYDMVIPFGEQVPETGYNRTNRRW